MSATLTAENLFELLELPDGRWCVARLASAATSALTAGSFARLETVLQSAATGTTQIGQVPKDPVGIYASRDAAELAIQRAAPSPRDPLAIFSAWLRQS